MDFQKLCSDLLFPAVIALCLIEYGVNNAENKQPSDAIEEEEIDCFWLRRHGHGGVGLGVERRLYDEARKRHHDTVPGGLETTWAWWCWFGSTATLVR